MSKFWVAFAGFRVFECVLAVPIFFFLLIILDIGCQKNLFFPPFSFLANKIGVWGILLSWELFIFCEEDEGEGDELVELVSFLYIALPMISSFCCTMLFWFDGVTSWMAIAVASVAVVVLLLLYFAQIIVMMICFSSC